LPPISKESERQAGDGFADDMPSGGADGGGGSRSRSELSEERARAALAPLGPGERPAALLIAVGVAGLLALGVAVGLASSHDLRRHGGSVPGGVFLAVVLAGLAWGMYGRRYWAVLGFEGLLAFQILVTSLALVIASTLLAAGLCLLSILLAGWLFWKLVRVMGRIQAGERHAQAATGEREATTPRQRGGTPGPKGPLR
jgi:hypothetical protein